MMAHKYEVKVLGQTVEVKGGSPRIALPRAMRKLGQWSWSRNDKMNWLDFQLKKGEELTIRMRRIE